MCAFVIRPGKIPLPFLFEDIWDDAIYKAGGKPIPDTNSAFILYSLVSRPERIKFYCL